MSKRFVFNKKVVMLLIQIIVVALTLVMAVGTYAWYSVQTNVEVEETTVTAAAGSNTTILELPDVPVEPYSGQTGTGFVGGEEPLDVPYVYTKNVIATFDPTQTDPYLTIKLTSMRVVRVQPHAEANSENNPEILGYFTWRATARPIASLEAEDEEERYAGPAVRLRPETSNRVETEIIDGESVDREVDYISTDYAIIDDPTHPNNGERYALNENLVTEITLELIFLDENSYLARLDVLERNMIGRKADMRDFVYSAYENMRAVFICTVEIGFDY